VLKKIGYVESGTSRYCRIINKNNGRTLTEDEAARYQQYDLFYLYVDPIVDYIHPALKDVLRIQAIDEPLLGRVIDENKFDKIDLDGKDVLLPCSNMLLMMKLNSFPNRTKDDKKVKDLCDIVSLIWYSGLEFAKVIESAKNDSRGNIKKLKDQLNSELLKEVTKHLSMSEYEVKKVLELLWL
jgi:hypothetical protein